MIPFSADFTVKNRNANYINRVDASQNSFATPFGRTYLNPVIFSGKGPSVYMNLKTKAHQKKIENFMWSFK